MMVGMPGEGNFRHSDTTLATMATEDDLTPRAPSNMDDDDDNENNNG